MNKTAIFTLLAAFFAGILSAQEIQLKQTAKAPAIDGTLAAGEWDGFALPQRPFMVWRKTQESEANSRVWMCWDDDNLYVALEFENLEKTPQSGDCWAQPRTEIFFGTEEKYTQVMRNIGGDIYPKGADWFRSASAFHGDSWIAEFAIPRARIPAKFSPYLMKGNIIRASKAENSCLFTILKPAFHAPDEFGLFLLGSRDEIIERHLSELKKKYGHAPNVGTIANTADLEKALLKLNEFTADREAERDQQLASALSLGKVDKVTGTSAASFPISKCWEIQEFMGKKFWVQLIPQDGGNFLRKGSATDIPFFREAMYNLKHFKSGDYFKVLLEASPEDNALGIALRKTNQPVMINATCTVFPKSKSKITLSDATIEQFLTLYGSRFAGMFSDESFGHNYTRCANFMGLQPPKTREEALANMEKMYQCEEQTLFQNWAVFHPKLKKLRSTATATFLDHQILGFGDPMSGSEIGGPGIDYMALQMAFSRGAGRQYGKPWRTYVATHDDWNRLKFPYRYNINGTSSFITPDERKLFWGGAMLGDYMGITREDYDKFYIYPYMAGTNIIFEESAHAHMTAKYDYRTIASEDRLAVNLREEKTYVSEITSRYADFYDRVIKRCDRGVAFTPVAMLWDHAHGILKGYSSLVWGTFERTEGDDQLWSIMQSCFPYDKTLYYDLIFKRCPFGDIFDVITNAADEKVLASYPVILLCGDVNMDSRLADALARHVKNGGTLIANIRQVRKYENLFPKMFFGAELDSNERSSAKKCFSRLSLRVISEEGGFDYAVVKPSSHSEVLAFTADERKAPLLLSTPYGRGRVILSTPPYLMRKYYREMMSLFDDLMHRINAETLPVTLECEKDIEYTINRNKNGWIVSLYNNYGTGYKRTVENPESRVNPDEVRKVVIRPKFKTGRVLEWLSEKEHAMRNDSLEIDVPPGAVKILEFFEK
jgi:hypothetical protein